MNTLLPLSPRAPIPVARIAPFMPSMLLPAFHLESLTRANVLTDNCCCFQNQVTYIFSVDSEPNLRTPDICFSIFYCLPFLELFWKVPVMKHSGLHSSTNSIPPPLFKDTWSPERRDWHIWGLIKFLRNWKLPSANEWRRVLFPGSKSAIQWPSWKPACCVCCQYKPMPTGQ